MPTKDLPDYTRQMLLKYDEGFIGLPELAARLGSVVPGSMPGDLVFYDQFDSELTDWEDVSTGNATAVRTSRHKFSGDWSVKLTNDNVGGYHGGTIRKYIHYPGAKKCGLFVRLGWDTDMIEAQVYMVVYTGSRKLQLALRYNYRDHTLSIWDNVAGYVNLTTDLYLGTSNVIFFPILLTFDLATEKYLGLYFADTIYSVSDYSLPGAANAANPYCYLQVKALSDPPPADFSAYLDTVALTVDVE